MKEDLAVTVRNQSQESSDPIDDELADFSPHISNTFKKKKRFRDRSHAARRPAGRERGEQTIDVSLIPKQARFCSRSEAICAELLQRFVPHFQLEEGVTFQVGIGKDEKGNTRTVDFLVDGVLFEYHPVRFFKNKRRCGDFVSAEEYRAYTRTFYSLTSDNREFFHSVMRAQLTENYFRRRRALLDQHPIFRRTELIVATSPEEFYFLVIRRFGKHYPKTVEQFIALFNELRCSLPE